MLAVLLTPAVAAQAHTNTQGASLQAQNAFNDDDGSVHEPALNVLAGRGYLAGTECGDGQICPTRHLQRWELAVWLGRALTGTDPDPIAESRFADVDPKQWWAPHVERFAELGITTGCKAEPLSYCPYSAVKRAQMASFLVRAFDLPEAASAEFTDTASTSHAANIDALAARKITAGCSREPLRFCPSTNVTRAQMATFIARAQGLVALPAAPTTTTTVKSPTTTTTTKPPTPTTVPKTKRYEVPTYFCAPKGRYSTRLMRSIVSDLNEQVNAFFKRESSGLADVQIVWKGSVSPPTDWSGTFDRYFESGRTEPDTRCEIYGINAAKGNRQILVLVALPADRYAGLAWLDTGPALVSLSGEETGEAGAAQSWLHNVVAHELGHSLFGWGHTDDPSIDTLDCGAVHRSLMTSGSDCYYTSGADPLSSYRVVCALRKQQNWPCGSQKVEAGNVPVSYEAWTSYWDDEGSISRGVLTESIRQTVPGNPEHLASIWVECAYSDQLAAWQLDLIISWGGTVFDIRSSGSTPAMSVRFADQTLLNLPTVASTHKKAFWIGEWNSGVWDSNASRTLLRAMINADGQTVTLFTYDSSNRLFQATFDTTGAKVAVQSVINFCDSKPSAPSASTHTATTTTTTTSPPTTTTAPPRSFLPPPGGSARYGDWVVFGRDNDGSVGAGIDAQDHTPSYFTRPILFVSCWYPDSLARWILSVWINFGSTTFGSFNSDAVLVDSNIGGRRSTWPAEAVGGALWFQRHGQLSDSAMAAELVSDIVATAGQTTVFGAVNSIGTYLAAAFNTSSAARALIPIVDYCRARM